MLLTDWVKVGVEGKTIDGRNIQREWLERAGELYSLDTYTAVINSEHFFFPGLGWVAEAKAEEDEQGRMALWARLVPTAEFIARNHNKRQLFFSMELLPGFPDEGDWYLSGLAVTDMPASQGLAPKLFTAERSPVADGRPERLLNTGKLVLTERGVCTSADPHEGDAAPPPPESPEPEEMPGWASRFLASIGAKLRGGATSTDSEEAMTPQERKEFDELKAAVAKMGEAVEKLTAGDSAQGDTPAAEGEQPGGQQAGKDTKPGAQPPAEEQHRPGEAPEMEKLTGESRAMADVILGAVKQQLEPINAKLAEVDGFMNEVRATEALEVQGGAGGDQSAIW